MKRHLLPLLCLLAVVYSSFSQQKIANEKEAVMRTINQVFIAMRTNDSTLLKESFIESPNIYTAYVDSKGTSQLVKGDFDAFITAVGQPKDQVWNEPIWNEKVEVDENLASVWVDYAFYLDDQFSHCGVDAFHLIKLNDGWKIFHLVDTRRKSDCDIPEKFRP